MLLRLTCSLKTGALSMNRVQVAIIKNALDEQHKLSDWESDFIDSVADKEASYELSEKQNSVLNRISDKLERA